MTVEAAQSDYEPWEVSIDGWGQNETLDSCIPGDSVTVIYDANAYGNIVGVEPSNIQYTVSGDNISFIMPDELVTFTSELPAGGASFDFVGYEHEEDENPSSTGTATYAGIYADDSTYLICTTYTGSNQEVEQEVYILRSDAPNMRIGEKVPVYVMNNDQLVQFGYGGFAMQ